MNKEEKIISLVDKEMINFSKEFREEIKISITKTAKGNKDKQMLLMPHFFYKSLAKRNKNINLNFLNGLGLMSAFFWTSFIIYDDFWDEDEKAQAKLLPLANAMSRHFFAFFNKLFKEDKSYHCFYLEALDKLDEANFFEITKCREMKAIDFDDMSLKFYPCVGHLFAPLAIMMKLGYKFRAKETKQTISFFKNYLIARQLSDDMHDIEEDWRRRHLSLAVNQLLKDAKGKNIDDHKKRNYLFWTKTIDILCDKSLNLLSAAKQNIGDNKAIKNKLILEKFCRNLENSAKHAISARDKKLASITAHISS